MSQPRPPSQSVATDPPQPPVGQRAAGRWRAVVAAAALVAMPLAAYAPVLRAGFIWDDHENVVTNPTLDSLDGLRQMWFVPQSIQQYYPLMYTSYWLEHRLWGLAPWGYHLTNILLHAAAAILVWRLLVRLQVPGAWLAAAIFAVHPVEVESVAWITERKNVLSLSLALLSMLCYLRFAPAEDGKVVDAAPSAARWWWYALALALFALALFAKTVVVTLPAVLLVIYWWKRGRITWQDVMYVVPFLALSVLLGLVTIWMETYHLGTHGKHWSLSPIERLLLAGRALWFYGGKLIWPHPLVFFYPRWTIDGHAWWQYLLPVTALSLPVALWLARRLIGRGPLAAVLIFAGVLAPMLGFFNIYFTMYAYVSDHFQYHASVALVALAVAAAALATAKLSPTAKALSCVGAGVLLLGLARGTFRQTFIYHDLDILYRDTIAKNPQGTIAYSNLAVHLGILGRHEEAVDLTRTALRLDPTDPIAHSNLGFFLLNLGSRDGFQHGQLEEAIANLRQGLVLARDACGAVPNEPRLRNYLGFSLLRLGNRDGFQPGQLEEAISHLNEAVRLDPASVDAHANLALALATAQRPAEAIQHAARALEIDSRGDAGLSNQLGPDLLAEGHDALAGALATKGNLRAAAEHYKATVDLRPDYDRALNNLGVVLMNLGQTDEAIHWFQEAVRQHPEYAEAKLNLKKALEVQNEIAPK
jgi:tetratricopeptide (TPR) repeat protein